MVSNQLEAANHLTNREEAEGLSEDDTASGKLGHADISYGVDNALRGSEDAAAGNGLPEALVEGLKGSGGAGGGLRRSANSVPGIRGFCVRVGLSSYGMAIFWFWATYLPSSRATLL